MMCCNYKTYLFRANRFNKVYIFDILMFNLKIDLIKLISKYICIISHKGLNNI